MTDIQYLNLLFLNAMRSQVLADPVSATYQFRMSPVTVTKLASMTQEELANLIQANPHESLFVPRSDLGTLLDAPIEMLGTLLAVREQREQDSFPRPERRSQRQPLMESPS
ncbi:hypothetical protein E4L96_19960 [Massilia arenosa]|uniref:Uncharacterized protein n=1 Tax=Zemynaea arenosa TaxID=2561931 RepID=A0A4Y9S056_9BURK|nr:hypothetical protein [Massilia arenosa]TFW13375.1 hypothetical protein E4L96_19960 [Massilia arenosa]